ncbi:MAG: shikimate kinase [Pirellulales bacterium]
MNVVLIGYRGTGKSSVGRLLARRWDCPFVDLDDEIERRAGMTIAEIFAAEGEPGFRRRESTVVQDVSGRDRHVIATGGGAVVDTDNRSALTHCGRVVWLKASPQSIHVRISADAATSARRPNLTASGGLEEIERVLGTRTPIYDAAADLTIDTEGKSPQDVADAIVARLGWDTLPAGGETA